MERAEKPFGEFVKEIRKERGMTQRELAAYLDVTQPEISNIESGKLTAPQDFKARFCERMGIREEPPPVPASATPTPALLQDPIAGASGILTKEIQAARMELDAPMPPKEAAALHGMEAEQLTASSAMLKAALELRTARELSAAARASRQRWEAKAREI